MATYYSGQTGSATGNLTANTVNYPLTSLTVNGSANILDTTTDASQGWQENIEGNKKATLTGKGYFDGAASPFKTSSGLGVVPGAAVTFTVRYGGSGKTQTFPGRIATVDIEIPQDGVVAFSFTAESNGVVSFPS